MALELEDELTKKLTAYAKKYKIQFTKDDQPMKYDQVFSDVGMLPALAKRADQLSSLCFGYGIGAVYEEDKEAVLGVRVKFDDVTPNTLRLLCIVDVIEELRKTSPSRDSTPLDELMYD